MPPPAATADRGDIGWLEVAHQRGAELGCVPEAVVWARNGRDDFAMMHADPE
jgi:hypothetical protein